MKKIFINADDFGASREINEGIKQAIKAGRVTSVSLMVERPFFQDAVKFLQKNPHVAVGLHFNLTEKPDGSSWFWPVSRKKIKEELTAQYHQLQQTGLPIVHLDSHEHVHLFPQVFQLFVEFAKAHRISRIRAAHFSWAQLRLITKIFPTSKQLIIWFLLGINYLLFLRQSGLRKTTPDFLFDLNWHDKYDDAHLSQLFAQLPDGTTEIICHLSSEVTNDVLSPGRRQCLTSVISKNFGRMLAAHHVLTRTPL